MYALLSGLNAATVGIIALAAVQLAEKAITDKLTRILVFLGGSAGMLYNALWYFPVLMVCGGSATVVWDYRWLHAVVKKLRGSLCGSRDAGPERSGEEGEGCVELQDVSALKEPGEPSVVRRAPPKAGSGDASTVGREDHSARTPAADDTERVVPANMEFRIFSWEMGTAIIAGFLVSSPLS